MTRLNPVTVRHLHREIILAHLKQAGANRRTNGSPYGDGDTVEFKAATEGSPGPAIETAAATLTDAGYTVADQTTHRITVGFANAPLPTATLSDADQDLLDRMITHQVYWQARISDWARTQHDPNHDLPDTPPAPLTAQEWATLGHALAALAETSPGAPASTAIITTWTNARRDDYRGYQGVISEIAKSMPNHFTAVAPEIANRVLAD